MTFATMTEAELRSQRTFKALMWAFSYPGRIQATGDRSRHFYRHSRNSH